MPRCMRGLVRYARAACHTSSQWQQSLHRVSLQLPLTITRRSQTQGSTTAKSKSSILPRVQYDVQTAQLAEYTQQPTLPKQATLVTLDARMRRKGKLLDVARSLRSVTERAKSTTPSLPATTIKDNTNATGVECKTKSVSETSKQVSPLVILVESGLTPAAARRRQRRWNVQLRRKQQQQHKDNGSPMRETYICVLDRHQTQAYKHCLSPATQEVEVHEKVEGATNETTKAEKAESENTVEVNTIADNRSSVTTTTPSHIPLAATLYYGASTEYLTVRCRALLPALANVLVVECPAWTTISHIETAIMLQPYRHGTNSGGCGGLFTPSAYKELTCVQSHDNTRLTPLLPFVYVFRTGLPSCVEDKQQARDLLQCAMYDDSGMHERDCVCVLDVSDTGGNPLLPFIEPATTSSAKEQLTTDVRNATSVPLLSWSERVAACVAHVDNLQSTRAPALPITENNEAPRESANIFLPTFLYNMHTLLQTVTKSQEVQQPVSITTAAVPTSSAATTAAEGAASVEEAVKEPSVTVDRVQPAHKQVKAVAKAVTTTTAKVEEGISTPRTVSPKTKQKTTVTKKKRVVRRRPATQLVLPTLRITVTRDPQPTMLMTTEKTELSKSYSMQDKAKAKKKVPALAKEQPTTLTTTNTTAIEKDVSSEYVLPLAVNRGLPLTRSLLHAMRYVLTTKDCTADNVRSYLSSLSISALLAGSRVYARVTPVASALRALLQLDTIPTTATTTATQGDAKEESDAWLTTLPATATIVCVCEKYPAAAENRNASLSLSRADTLEGGGKDADDEMTSAEARTVATMVMALIEANVKTGPKAAPIIGIVYRNNLHSAAQCSAVRERIARLLEKHTRYVPVALFVLMMVS